MESFNGRLRDEFLAGDQLDSLLEAGGGSIPARAGEPRRARRLQRHRGVYPRASGGTDFDADVGAWIIGLSPRERGNHDVCCCSLNRVRSIPARAGEPSAGRSLGTHTPVYPRASGGTWRGRTCVRNVQGLSPRERGNRRRRRRPEHVVGSIPARAGEPAGQAPAHAPGTVYPRASGGTVIAHQQRVRRYGLSPRERGNLILLRFLAQVMRSIPARAGEPRPPAP